jgi:hypothetical protein
LFLSSPKPVLKFAAIRSLNKLSQSHPGAVAGCNLDIENLITDTNRSIATYAITTLLKTGNEASVDRLMKQISGFMTEITDEFKIIVVDAIRSLCLKFPSKQAVMLSFLSGVLRDEGGYDFKRAVVDAIFDMIKYIGECKEAGMWLTLIADSLHDLTISNQLLLTFASSSKIASSPSSLFKSFISLDLKAPKRSSPQSSFDTSTTEWSWKTLLFEQQLCQVSPNSVFPLGIRPSLRASMCC